MVAEPVRRARNGKGRFVRTVANISRDRQAAEAVERGMTYEQAAAEFGFDSRQSAFRAVQQIRRENTLYGGATQEARQRQLDEMQQARRVAWSLIMDPLPSVSRTGKVVTDSEGNEVPDGAHIAAMLALVIRASEREARLLGTEMPRRSISLTGKSDVEAILALMDTCNPQDLHEAVAEMHRRVAAASRETEAEEGPRAIPGAVEE